MKSLRVQSSNLITEWFLCYLLPIFWELFFCIKISMVGRGLLWITKNRHLDTTSQDIGTLGQEPWMMNTYRFLVFLQYHMSSVDTQRGDLNPLIRKRPSFPLPLPSAVFPAVSRAYFLWIPGWCLSSLSGSTQAEQLPWFTCFSPGFTICSRLLVPRVSFYYVIALLCQNLSVHH